MLKDRKAQIELVKSYRKPTDAEAQEILDHLLDEDAPPAPLPPFIIHSSSFINSPRAARSAA